MNLQITNIQRVNPAPCDHWNMTVQNGQGQTFTLVGIHRSELQNRDRFDDAPWWVVLAVLWLRARLVAGFTLANSVTVEIIG